MVIDLVHYPTTTAPVSGSVTVTTQCANNAHQTSSSLNVSCTSSGGWSGTTPQCQCDTRYRAVTGSERLICKGYEFSEIIALTSIVFITFTALPACEARVIGLVHYPTTRAPVSGSVTVTTQCADNAHIIDTASHNVTCESDGSWSGLVPQCECDFKYNESMVNGRHICHGEITQLICIQSSKIILF